MKTYIEDTCGIKFQIFRKTEKKRSGSVTYVGRNLEKGTKRGTG